MYMSRVRPLLDLQVIYSINKVYGLGGRVNYSKVTFADLVCMILVGGRGILDIGLRI